MAGAMAAVRDVVSGAGGHITQFDERTLEFVVPWWRQLLRGSLQTVRSGTIELALNDSVITVSADLRLTYLPLSVTLLVFLLLNRGLDAQVFTSALGGALLGAVFVVFARVYAERVFQEGVLDHIYTQLGGAVQHGARTLPTPAT